MRKPSENQLMDCRTAQYRPENVLHNFDIRIKEKSFNFISTSFFVFFSFLGLSSIKLYVPWTLTMK